MCFSATASFSAGIALTVIGVAAIKKIQHTSQTMFASIPLIFGIQQIAEGILWVSLPYPDLLSTQKTFTYIFLFFAQIVWPIWTPISIMLLEKKGTRKRIQQVLAAAGILVGVYLGICLLLFSVEAKIEAHHIVYLQNYPVYFSKTLIVLYFFATVVPAFFSRIKHMWLLGGIILISYLISVLFYDHYLVSVWCFFASIISVSVYAIMRTLSREKRGGTSIRA